MPQLLFAIRASIVIAFVMLLVAAALQRHSVVATLAMTRATPALLKGCCAVSSRSMAVVGGSVLASIICGFLATDTLPIAVLPRFHYTPGVGSGRGT